MKTLVNLLSWLVAFLVLIKISSLKFSISNIYYPVLFSVFIILFISSKKIKINYLIVWLVIASVLSIIFNDIPIFFQPYKRLFAFIIVLGLIGPLIGNPMFYNFRSRLFGLLNQSILILVSLSFIGISAGLLSMIGRGGYVGFFNHSMMLGPMSSIAMLVAINNANTTNNRNKKWFFLSLASMAFITSVAAGSRSALISGIVGSLFYYYKINQGRISRFISIIMLVVVIGTLSFSLWDSYTIRLMGKIYYSESKGDILESRSGLWKIRIAEFKSSPFIGVGFASVDPKLNTKFDSTSGSIEPGSSWLAVLSMTGVLGFIPLILLTLIYFRYLFREKNNPTQSAFLGGMLFVFIVHMMAEGYVLSAGSGLFFYFWLTSGVIEQCSYYNLILNTNRVKQIGKK